MNNIVTYNLTFKSRENILLTGGYMDINMAAPLDNLVTRYPG